MINLILAAMLRLAIPGVSDGSRVQIEGDCDTECRVYWDRHGTATEDEYSFARADWGGWTRRETRQEALTRWVTIATAIAAVEAQPPEGWRGSPGELWRALVTITRHESAGWGAVHEGRLRGSAGEVCLVQVHPDNWERLGISDDAASVIGTGAEATERCLRAGAEMLTQARAACGMAGVGAGWFGPSVALYGTGNLCEVDAEFVVARVNTYETTWRPGLLAFDARLAVEHATW